MRESFNATWRPRVGRECADALWNHRVRTVLGALGILAVLVYHGYSTAYGQVLWIIMPVLILAVNVSSAIAVRTWSRHCNKKVPSIILVVMNPMIFDNVSAENGWVFTDELVDRS